MRTGGRSKLSRQLATGGTVILLVAEYELLRNPTDSMDPANPRILQSSINSNYYCAYIGDLYPIENNDMKHRMEHQFWQNNIKLFRL
jgi:hypothetical protein